MRDAGFLLIEIINKSQVLKRTEGTEMLARICLTSKINVNSEHGLTCMSCTIPSTIIILDCVRAL
jgi:hypothetical protein